MQKIKNFISRGLVAIFALSVLSAPALAGGAVYAATTPDVENNLCQGGANLQFSDSPEKCGPATQGAEGGINDLIAQVINIFSVIVGVVAVIMIIVGGFRYITSGGDSGNVTSAKNTILYAIVGLVIVALAQFIVKFVLSKATA